MGLWVAGYAPSRVRGGAFRGLRADVEGSGAGVDASTSPAPPGIEGMDGMDGMDGIDGNPPLSLAGADAGAGAWAWAGSIVTGEMSTAAPTMCASADFFALSKRAHMPRGFSAGWSSAAARSVVTPDCGGRCERRDTPARATFLGPARAIGVGQKPRSALWDPEIMARQPATARQAAGDLMPLRIIRALTALYAGRGSWHEWGGRKVWAAPLL